MEDLTNLNPKTDREWFQFLSHKMDNLMESQSEDREILIKTIDRLDGWIVNHDKCYTEHIIKEVAYQRQVDANLKEIDGLRKKSETWNTINSIGVSIVAVVAALLGLRGS